MGCGWWNPPTPYKDDCYWYREEQDMNARIPHCPCTNQFPLNSCENCEDYHSRSKRTRGDHIRAMTDEELADYFAELSCWPNAGREDCRGVANCMDCWLDWLKQEVSS